MDLCLTVQRSFVDSMESESVLVHCPHKSVSTCFRLQWYMMTFPPGSLGACERGFQWDHLWSGSWD
jgi:hypothetical protein